MTFSGELMLVFITLVAYVYFLRPKRVLCLDRSGLRARSGFGVHIYAQCLDRHDCGSFLYIGDGQAKLENTDGNALYPWLFYWLFPDRFKDDS